MGNRAGERRDSSNVISQLEIIKQGQITKEQMDIIDPFLTEFKAELHKKWESCGLMDGATAKILHFHVKTVNELQRLMKVRVTRGIKAERQETDNG